MLPKLLLCNLIFLFLLSAKSTISQTPLKVAVSGLTHGHVYWIFNRKDKNDIQIVGIYESNKDLVKQYRQRYNLDSSLFFDNLDKMLDKVKPEAVLGFGAISEHITIVRSCAPRKINVMVEKPLATTFKDAKEIQSLAQKYSIQVLTNFETSWYSSNQYVYDLVNKGTLGDIRKVIVNDGHQGPKEINVSKEFFEILTDPKKNGADALFDFGCYGANLMSWLLKGTKPISVTAVTHQNKPNIYPHVDDEATIILQYDKTQCIIQASWNWTFSRKDMEVYGTKGYAIAVDGTTVRQKLSATSDEERIKLETRQAPFNDPFSVLAEVIRGGLKLEQFDQYALPLNVLVVEILDAARESAKTGKTIFLK